VDAAAQMSTPADRSRAIAAGSWSDTCRTPIDKSLTDKSSTDKSLTDSRRQITDVTHEITRQRSPITGGHQSHTNH
jgi:hypothetical protein